MTSTSMRTTMMLMAVGGRDDEAVTVTRMTSMSMRTMRARETHATNEAAGWD